MGKGSPPAATRFGSFIIFAYLLQLTIPALLLADIVISRLRGEIQSVPLFPEGAIAGISALWLLAGLGLLLLTPNRQILADRVAAPLLSFYTLGLLLLMAEAAVRLLGITTPIPRPRCPAKGSLSCRALAITSGSSGTKTYTINRLGLRGPMPPKFGPVYKIVAIGGSTTICTFLDDSEAWPQLLMTRINASETSLPVWVGNAGIDGVNSVNHLVLMQWLPGALWADMVIFLVGVNDLQASLAFEGAPTQTFLEKDAQFQGDLPAGTLWRSKYPRYRRLKLFTLIQQAIRNVAQRLDPPPAMTPSSLVEQRRQRAASAVVPLPDLSTGLKEYRTRILALASRCRDLKQRCLFLTQPSLWRDDLRPDEQRLLWFGYTGRFKHPKGYVSAGNMARAMDMYNQTLLEVCRESRLECFDIASRIPKDTSAFDDDVHFTANGSRLVAQALQQYLLSRAPFGPSR